MCAWLTYTLLGDNTQMHHIVQADSVSEAEDFHTKSNVPHPMIDIYEAFGVLIITLEWVVR